MARKIRRIFNLIIVVLVLFSTISYSATSTTETALMDIIRDMVGEWYFIFRYFSIALMLVVLIYLGIRAAISSIAEEKAKYKRMLVDWVVGFIIIFTIHYYMILIIKLNEICVGLVEEASKDLAMQFLTGEEVSLGLKPSTQGLYEMVRTRAYEFRFSLGTSGMIMYMVLVYYTIKFILIYFKRFFTVLILTIMAPLMGLFYAFNKINSGKAVTFKKWASEYAFNVFLQTIHAIIYGIFVQLAIGLSTQSIIGFILAMIMLNMMSKAEKLFRSIFKLASGGIAGENTDKGIRENLAGAKALKATTSAVFGSQMAKDIGKGIRNAAGGVGNLAATGVLNHMNKKVDDEGLEKAENELKEEMKKPESDRSAEKIKKLENTIADISAQKAKVQKYRGGIKDPEKLRAKINKATKGAKTEEEKKEIEERIRKENERSIVKKDKFKNILTGEEERVSIGNVLKGEINQAIWGNNEVKDATKDLVKTVAGGITGAAMIFAGIPLAITEPGIGMALLSKGISNANKLYGNNEYKKVTTFGERQAIRRIQKKKYKKYKEERRTIRKDYKQLKKRKKYSFNRYGPGSLETIKAQMIMDKKVNSIQKMNSLTLGNLALTAPLRLTGVMGGIRTVQSKAYKIQEARRDYYEKVETFMTLEKKESISKDFTSSYNVKVEGIKKKIDAKSDVEIAQKYGEDSGKIVTVGKTKLQFGKNLSTPSSPQEITNSILDNALLKVAARNKVLDIKELNLNSKKIQTQLVEEFRKVGVLDETIIPEEFELDKTLKLNIDKLEDRVNIISINNPKAVEETIAKEVIVDYMERNNIEDANEIKKEGHKEKIKQEILQIIEQKEDVKSSDNEKTEPESTTDFSQIITASIENFENDRTVETVKSTEESKIENFENIVNKVGVENRSQQVGESKKSEISETIEEVLAPQDFIEVTSSVENANAEQATQENKIIEDTEIQDFASTIGAVAPQDISSKTDRLNTVVEIQVRQNKREERLELFENLIDSLEKTEPEIIEDMLENEMIANERKRQAGAEKDVLDAQLEGFEKVISEGLDDTRAIDNYIENETSPEVDELLAQLLALKEQDMIGLALKFKPTSYERRRMESIDSDRINSTYKKKI